MLSEINPFIIPEDLLLPLNPQITKTDEKAFSLTLIPDNQILIYHYEKTGFSILKSVKSYCRPALTPFS
jgi:hypothetical protein